MLPFPRLPERPSDAAEGAAHRNDNPDTDAARDITSAPHTHPSDASIQSSESTKYNPKKRTPRKTRIRRKRKLK